MLINQNDKVDLFKLMINVSYAVKDLSFKIDANAFDEIDRCHTNIITEFK